MENGQATRRCRGTTRLGKPCRAAATVGGLCFFHANPAKAVELGRLGGRRNGHRAFGNLDPLPALNTMPELRDYIIRMLVDVSAGKTSPRTAAGIAPLLRLLLRMSEGTDLEPRIAKLEKQMGAEDTTNAPKFDPVELRKTQQGVLAARRKKDEEEKRAALETPKPDKPSSHTPFPDG